MRIQAARPQDRELSFERQQRLAEYVSELNRFGDEYSICRAIMRLAEPQSFGANLEEEISHQVGQRLGIEHARGMLVPLGLRFDREPSERALTTTAGAGGQFVFTRPGTLLEMLRNQLVIGRLGTTLLDGLQGPISFPKQLTGGTLTWTAQNPGSDVADSDLTTGSVPLSPKSAQSSTAYSRQLLAQSSIDVEALVRADLVAINAQGIDRAAINGAGTLEPLGILKTAGIGDVAIGTDGGYPTLSHLFDLESKTFSANVRGDSYGFLTTPAVRGYLRKTLKIAGSQFPLYIWPESEQNRLLAYNAQASQNVPSTLVKGSKSDCSAIIFGNWSDLVVGTWGVLEIIVDPYRLKKQAIIEVTSFIMCDVALRYPEAFAAIQDARVVA